MNCSTGHIEAQEDEFVADACDIVPAVDCDPAGGFRQDLYYRLDIMELHRSVLKDRRDDLLPLAWHFLTPGFQLSAAAERALLEYSWPGDVPELKNCIRRACLLSLTPLIDAADLYLPSNEKAEPFSHS